MKDCKHPRLILSMICQEAEGALRDFLNFTHHQSFRIFVVIREKLKSLALARLLTGSTNTHSSRQNLIVNVPNGRAYNQNNEELYNVYLYALGQMN